MSIADKLPDMDVKDIATLRTNALRWQDGDQPKQQAAAADLIPLIDAELADRKAKAPPPPPKAPRKTAAKAAAKPPADPDAPKPARKSRAKKPAEGSEAT